MDILYIIGEGCSRCDNLELRCSLRSIDTFGKNVGRVFVAGYCPEWLSDEVVKLPFNPGVADVEDHIRKNLNILRIILHAVDHSDIGEDFLVSMDDHFYVRDVDFDAYPYYVKQYPDCTDGQLPSGEQRTAYKKHLAAVRELLESRGMPALNFTLHRNMHLSRAAIDGCRGLLDECIEKNLPCETTVIVNNYLHGRSGIDYVLTKDVKLKGCTEWWKTDPCGTEVFSTADFGENDGLAVLLRGLYNKKSKYEI